MNTYGFLSTRHQLERPSPPEPESFSISPSSFEPLSDPRFNDVCIHHSSHHPNPPPFYRVNYLRICSVNTLRHHAPNPPVNDRFHPFPSPYPSMQPTTSRPSMSQSPLSSMPPSTVWACHLPPNPPCQFPLHPSSQPLCHPPFQPPSKRSFYLLSNGCRSPPTTMLKTNLIILLNRHCHHLAITVSVPSQLHVPPTGVSTSLVTTVLTRCRIPRANQLCIHCVDQMRWPCWHN